MPLQSDAGAARRLYPGSKPLALCWSGGKDCAWALHILRSQGAQVAALVTTVRADSGCVAMHDVPGHLIAAQAAALRIPLWTVPLPWPCPNAEYESRMAALCRRALESGVHHMAFGDLFLRDIRDYRERSLAGTGIEPLFPLWDLPTGDLARAMIAGGLKARLVSVDTRVLGAEFAGREFDLDLLRDLPPGVDPCGENGEFHTFVCDGPMFTTRVEVRPGEVREEGSFAFAGLS